MGKIRKTFLIKAALALLIIFTLSDYIFFVWRNPIGYYLLIVCASFLGGIVIADVGRGLLSVLTIYIVSCLTFVLLNIFPLTLFGAPEEIDIVIYVTTTELAKQVLITLPILVFTCIYGCFLGKSFRESD